MVAMAGEIVGYFGDSGITDVPLLLQAAVLLPDNRISIGEPDVDDAEFISADDFTLRISEGGGVRLDERQPWDRDRALFLQARASTPTYETYVEIDKRLRSFVNECREAGRQALARDSQYVALKWFDRARRVSNEPDDYVRVWGLEDREHRGVWLDWLKTNAPNIDPIRRAEALGLMSKKQIFAKTVGQRSRVNVDESCA
jgi:hypothetical protein